MTFLPPDVANDLAFAKGFGEGALSLAKGVKDLTVAGYHLATDPAARDAFAQGAQALSGQAAAYAQSVGQDPGRVLDDAKALAGQATQAYRDALAKAEAQGISPDQFNAELAGRGAFEVASLLVPETKLAELAKTAELAKAAQAAKAAEVLTDAKKAEAGVAVARCGGKAAGGGGVGAEGANPLIQSGGAYSDVKGLAGYEAHHMPADSISPLSTSEGPSIAMPVEDHRLTASWGNSREARAYRKIQADLIAQGDFKAAQQMDIDDVVAKFGNKYDNAVKQMLKYSQGKGLW